MPSRSARARRRRLRRTRRVLMALALLGPGLALLVCDVARRGESLVALRPPHRSYYLVSLGISFGFWASLLFVATRRRGAMRQVFVVIFVALFGLACGVQGAFFSIFRTYACAETDVYTRSFGWAVLASLPLGRGFVWVHLGGAAALGGVLAWVARASVRPRRSAARAGLWVALAALGALAFVKSSYRPVQASTADVLYFHAVVASFQEQLGVTQMAARTRPQPRRPASVPDLQSTNEVPRNVLFILQESQRFDVTCTEYDPACQLATRASNRAVPDRAPFLRWHALGSSTSLACLTLWTGLLPSDPLADLERAPTLFRYAKAAGYETAYFTSQHLSFQNMRLQVKDEPLDHFAHATTLEPDADWDTGASDASLSDHVIERWDRLREPFYVVVHYANQHQPYVEDPQRAPFALDPREPYDSVDNQIQRNKNVVYLSDLAVGRLLEKVRRSESGARTVILYTSDHGESLGDRGSSGHTVSLYESEIHVPAWVDAPAGVTSHAEATQLQQRKLAWLTHADLAPTVLDLLGVWDAPALQPFRAKMVGTPLTRPQPPPAPIPLTNDSWIWESNQRNWGYLRGSQKTFGIDGDERLRCFDLETDPGERHDLGESGCGELPRLTRELFPSLVDANRPYRPLR